MKVILLVSAINPVSHLAIADKLINLGHEVIFAPEQPMNIMLIAPRFLSDNIRMPIFDIEAKKDSAEKRLSWRENVAHFTNKRRQVQKRFLIRRGCRGK